jgi:hypothetical protein
MRVANMPEQEVVLRKLLGKIDFNMESFIDRVNTVWAESEEARDTPEELLRFLRDAEPTLLDLIEQLDRTTCLLGEGKNSYVSRTTGDWRSRLPLLARKGVLLADIRHELLQCGKCGTLYRAKRDDSLRLTTRYWECPQKCNR